MWRRPASRCAGAGGDRGTAQCAALLFHWQAGRPLGCARGWAAAVQPPCPFVCRRGAPHRSSHRPAVQVLIVDPNPLAPWINNFGVWIDEFELMGLSDCLDYKWDRALVYLSSEADGAR